jgi:hypothetical protein
MKKSNFLKTVLGVATAMLMTGSVMGQVANTDYQVYDAVLQGPSNIDYVTLRTGGSTVMGYYALPDVVYHPNYTAIGGWTLTAGFVWNWSVLPAMATAKPGAANYVQITYTATGNYAVTVAEQAPVAMGSCADATPTEMNVTVISPPVATITTADPVQACGDQLAMAVAMTFTEAIPVALAGYAFAINETVENIDVSNNPIGAALVDNDAFVDFPTTAKLETPTLTGAGSPYGYSFNTTALTVRNSLRTRYTYTAIKASDAPAAAANGVISAISQKSDYVAEAGGADYLTYAFTDSQIVIIINPAPSTGPIYYIPNDFNY